MATRRVKAVFAEDGEFIGYQNPDKPEEIIAHDEAVSNLEFNPDTGTLQDSTGQGVGVAGVVFPPEGSTFDFKYKTAEYFPLLGEPQDFNPVPGSSLLLRVVMVDANGAVNVGYKSFGENQPWSQDTEDKLIQEQASDQYPNLFYILFGSNRDVGVEISKEYVIQRVSTRPLG